MTIRTLVGQLYARDESGRPQLVGEVGGLEISLDPATRGARIVYPSDSGILRVEFDQTNSEVVRLFFRPSRRLLALRRQAKRKGRPGWKRGPR